MAETWFFPDTVEYQCSSGYAAWKNVLSYCLFFNGDPVGSRIASAKEVEFYGDNWWQSPTVPSNASAFFARSMKLSYSEEHIEEFAIEAPCILCCIWRACDILCIRWSRCTLATLPLLCTRDLWKSHGATLRALVLEVDKKALLFTSHASQMPHSSDMRCQCVGMECWSWPQSLLRNPGMKLMETEPDSWQSMCSTKCL